MSNLSALIVAGGYIGIFVAVFAESGFFLGFFLPGDSLLFTIGIFASQGQFNIVYLIILSIIAAILGDSFGYWMGKKFGIKLFDRSDSWIFKREYVYRTQNFFKKHGEKAIILARFVPIVRTFTPILAGIGSMDYKTFLRNNIIGGILWAGGMLGAGYFLGSLFPNIEKYLSYIIIAIILISFMPFVSEFLSTRKKGLFKESKDNETNGNI